MISLEGAFDMIMYIPTPIAMTFKSNMMKIIYQYIAGDLSTQIPRNSGDQEHGCNSNIPDASKSFSKFMQVVEQGTKEKLCKMM